MRKKPHQVGIVAELDHRHRQKAGLGPDRATTEHQREGANLARGPPSGTLSYVELESLIRPRADRVAALDDSRTAEEITGLSADTLKRTYPHLLVRPSERRVCIKLRSALAIADGAAVPTRLMVASTLMSKS